MNRRPLNRLPPIPYGINGTVRAYTFEFCAALGLNEGLFIQQLMYWLERSSHQYDGRWWVYNTYEQWQEQFPWWSVPTIKRLTVDLEASGLVLVGNYNQRRGDRTKWYSLDFDHLARVLEAWRAKQEAQWGSDDSVRGSDQNDPSNESDRSEPGINMTPPVPTTTQETSNGDRPLTLEERLAVARDPRAVRPRRPG